MKRPLLVSTGALVGRVNGYDLAGALEVIRNVFAQGLCAGLEWMMVTAFYDRQPEVIREMKNAGVPIPVIHFEKDIGTLLSDAGAASDDGSPEEGERLRSEALRLFRLNCAFARELAVPRAVLHLWGGYTSDLHIRHNIEALPALSEIARENGLRLLIENVPSSLGDPLSNWKRLLPFLGDGGLSFDTRFGQLHDQIGEILTDPEAAPRIEHIHVSDFGGGTREFSALRPILHPGEGRVDFPAFARLLDRMGYEGAVTLESPVMSPEGRDVNKLKNTLRTLGELFCGGKNTSGERTI